MLDILKRHLTCTKCKEIWNVSVQAAYVNSTYICPFCEKGDKNEEHKEINQKTKEIFRK